MLTAANPALPWIILLIVVGYLSYQLKQRSDERRAAAAAEKAKAKAEHDRIVAERHATEKAAMLVAAAERKAQLISEAVRQQDLINAIQKLPENITLNLAQFSAEMTTLATGVITKMDALPAALEAKLGERLKEDYGIANGYLQGIQKLCEKLVATVEGLSDPVTKLSSIVQAPANPEFPPEPIQTKREDQEFTAAKLGYILQGKTHQEAEALAKTEREVEGSLRSVELNFR